ncbi:MAG: alpha/beta fold hydrolase [Candidatus Promineifilaceae bacterium]
MKSMIFSLMLLGIFLFTQFAQNETADNEGLIKLSNGNTFAGKTGDPVSVGTYLQARSEHELRAIACPMPLPPSEIEGETVECGALMVPENYDKPDGAQIELVFAILRTTNLSPARDPIIYLHGGPGTPELNHLAALRTRFADFLHTRDVIVLDQRGAGYSSGPLDCATALAADPTATLSAIRAAEDGSSDAIASALEGLCTDIALARSADLTQYNTVNNARDVLALKEALLDKDAEDYNAFNLYAWSYGTLLALEAVRQDESGLRSIVLDGVVPPNLRTKERALEATAEVVQGIFEACAEDDDCAVAYPDLQSRFLTLAEQLDEQPVQLASGQIIDAQALVNLFKVINNPEANPSVAASIPRIISELEQGTTVAYEDLTNAPINLLPPDPVTLRPGDLVALLDAGEAAAMEAAALQEQSAALLAHLQDLVRLASQPLTPAQAFDQKVRQLIAEDGELVPTYAALAMETPEEANVQAFVDGLSNDQAQALANVTAALSASDVVDLFRMLQGRHREEGFGQLASTLLPNRIIHCNDYYPFNTSEGESDFKASLDLWPVTLGSVDGVALEQEVCQQLEISPSAPSSFSTAVESDLPVLLLSGTFDSQTASSWAEVAAQKLPNSYQVTFPGSGHGTTQYSPCARAVAAAFVATPQVEPLSTCTAALETQFDLGGAVEE